METNFTSDKEKIRKRLEFLQTYGDPIDGLNKKEFDSLWYPSWFTLKRILFCVTTLYLWDRPLFLLYVRMSLFIVTYLYIATDKLYEKPLTTRLELMNQAVAILLIDVMILFTAVLNEGNPDDLNFGSVYDKKLSD